MHQLKYKIESTDEFSYYVYHNQTLLVSDKFAITDDCITANFIPAQRNRVRLYTMDNNKPVNVLSIQLDNWEPEFLNLSCKYFPIPNEVDPDNICWTGSLIETPGYILLDFSWPFENWYFEWLDQNWNTLTQHN